MVPIQQPARAYSVLCTDWYAIAAPVPGATAGPHRRAEPQTPTDPQSPASRRWWQGRDRRPPFSAAASNTRGAFGGFKRRVAVAARGGRVVARRCERWRGRSGYLVGGERLNGARWRCGAATGCSGVRSTEYGAGSTEQGARAVLAALDSRRWPARQWMVERASTSCSGN